MGGYHRFIVASGGGTVVNEYRMVDGRVQFRRADTTNNGSRRWRMLSDRDLHLHLTLHTDVGKWIARSRHFFLSI